MYNLLFGMNPLTKLILELLDLDKTKIERFRDCGFDDVIWIYTRTGGSNREYYPNVTLTSHINYIKYTDDNFDETYSMYEFTIPEDKIEEIKIIKELMEISEINWERPNWDKKFKELKMDVE